MNVSKSQIEVIMRTYLKNADYIKEKKAASKQDKISLGNCKDEVELSDDVKEFAETVKLALQTDYVRTEKVKELRDKINAGTYNIDGKLIADKILSEYFNDKMI